MPSQIRIGSKLSAAVGDFRETLAEARARVDGTNKRPRRIRESLEGIVIASTADGWRVAWGHNNTASVHKSGALRYVGPSNLSADDLRVLKERIPSSPMRCRNPCCPAPAPTSKRRWLTR